MITLICFLITLVGSVNWFCIGALQYDFIAGMFGSQANLFSRIVYIIVGLSCLWLIFGLIRTKGILKVDGKKSTDRMLLGKLGNQKNNKNTNGANTNNNTQNNNTQPQVNYDNCQRYYNNHNTSNNGNNN